MTWRARLWRVAYLLVVAYFLFSVARFYKSGTGFSDMIDFGSQFEDGSLALLKKVPHYVLRNSAGYDGQFYAQIALDPSLRDPELGFAVDNLPYRSRRILLPSIAYVLGIGRPAWIVQAYALLNVISWLFFAAVLLRWFPPSDIQNFVRWTGVLFSLGMITSVSRSLCDGPSLLLIACALLLLERNQSWWSAGVLAVAGLGRETNLLAAVVFADPESRGWGRWRRIILQGVLVAAPLALWTLYVVRMTDSSHIGGSGNFAGFLSGYAGRIHEIHEAIHNHGLFFWFSWNSLLGLIALTVQVAFLLLRPRWRNPWWRLGFVYAILFLFLGGAVWGGYPSASGRVLLVMLLAFNVLIPRSWKWFPVLLLGNLAAVSGLREIRTAVPPDLPPTQSSHAWDLRDSRSS